MESAARLNMHVGVLGPMTLSLLPLPEAQLATLPQGYPAPIISSIVNGLLERGATVTAFTTSVGVTDTQVWENDNFRLVVVPRQRPRSAFTMFQAERRAILDALYLYRPDVLSAHWSYEFAAAAVDSGIPSLITIRDHAATILRMKRDVYRLLRLALNGDVLRRGRYFSVTSPYMLQLLPSRTRRATSVISNFCDESLIACADRDWAERKRVIVTVSNGFGGRKNIAMAIKAFAESGAIEHGWKYLLLGDQLGPGEEAHLWAERHGLATGVTFLGRIPYEAVLREVGSARMMIHPAREESFGMTVLEAMQLGTPVIGGESAGNVPHLLAQGAGVLCCIESSGPIAAAVASLIADDDLAQEIGLRGRARATELFGRRVAIDGYMTYLAEILAWDNIERGNMS